MCEPSMIATLFLAGLGGVCFGAFMVTVILHAWYAKYDN